MRRRTSAGLMLGQRRRLWASIGPALGQRLIHSLYCHQGPFNYINYKGYAQIYCVLSGSLNLLFCADFVRSYFSLSFHPINMEFAHHIPRVVRYCAMTFLSHSACSSGFIQDFLDHFALQMQKAVSAYL